MKRWVIIIVALVVVIGAFWIWKGVRTHEEGTAQYRMGVADRGTVETQVTATGTVSAVTTVQVGTQVSGTIQNLYVDYNSQVHKGQIIARLDPTSLETTVKQSQASLDQAKAKLAEAQRDLTRTKGLYDKNLAAQSDYDTALTAVDVAQANVESAQADLDRAKINLAYSVITSPTDGTVISRNVDVGQTVAASLQAPTLFTIAQDLRLMQIEADIDESDVGGLRDSMEATFTVDAFPDETFHGRIQQIRNAASSSQGVVTYPVMISVSNPELKLRPGMTANVTIVTAQRDDVLRVPAIATRFRPPDAPLPQYGHGAAKNDTSHAQGQTPGQGQPSGQMAGQGMRGQGTPGGGGHGSQGQGRGQWQGRGQGQGHDSTGTQGASSERRMRKATVWVKGPDGKPQPHQVTMGLNDGNHVEVLGGDIAAGDSVIVGMTGASSSASSSSNRMPGFGGPMGPGGGPRR